MKRLKHKMKQIFPLSIKDILILLVVLAIAFAASAILQFYIETSIPATLIFVMSVLIISRLTNGYLYGIVASVAAVFGVNYAFTYPYFTLNFTMTDYPITFILMLAVSIITCTLTTQIKQQEIIRIESEKEKTRANLLRAISHDLRTPLTSIIGAVTLILESEQPVTPEKQSELLADAKQDAEWLIRMVDNLLSITRIGDEVGKIKKECEAVEEVIGEAAGKFKKHYPNISIPIVIPAELLMVPMDAMLIEQVISNLLFNSVLHGLCTTVIRLSVRQCGECATFTVEDNGVGLPDDILVQINEGSIKQADKREVVDNNRSMGIGLSVCLTIVRAHGGIMRAENVPDGGALIGFSLPLEV